MDLVTQIKLFKELGYGVKTIARELGVSKNTVKKYLSCGDLSLEVQQTARFDTLINFFPYCKKELTRTGVTRQMLWAEYRFDHPDGYSYSQFCEHYSQWLGNTDVTMHIEQQPGDRMYIDFTGTKLSLVDPDTGEIAQVEVFVATLGHSGFTFVRALPSQKKECFLDGIVRTLNYCGAVPKVLVPDNLRSGVDKASRYEAEINHDLLDLGNHYGMAILPTRSCKPRDKAWVERMVQIIYTRVFAPLRNQIFTSLDELNRVILELVNQHNDLPLQGRSQSRRELFETYEKPVMKLLPVEKYELKEYLHVKVMKNSHIQLHRDRHYYSVPYPHIGKKVKLVFTETYVSVYLHSVRIAYHLRDRRPFKYTTLKEHLPTTHQFVSEWNPERFIEWAGRIHPDVKNYINRVLEHKSYPEQTYRSCVGILTFGKKAGNDRLIAACQRADGYGVYNYKVIEQIINNKLDRLESPTVQQILPLHENIRGADYYK